MDIFADPTARPVFRAVGRQPIAHTPGVSGAVHPWADHAREVGRLAGLFGAKWGLANFMTLAGVGHDCGKLAAEVQGALFERARTGSRAALGIDHKFEGAALSLLFRERGDDASAHVLAGILWGHHGNLPDPAQLHERVWSVLGGSRAMVQEYLTETKALTGMDLEELAATGSIPSELYRGVDGKPDPLRLEHLTRMCHSALVDADFLDTAAHFTATLPARHDDNPTIAELANVFESAYAEKFGGVADTPLNRLRSDLYEACVAAGGAPVNHRGGIYRLPAQTGCGKTLASAAFALEHARVHNKSRVIVAVPFTTITTQNAEVYRGMFEALGEQVVLEHHSNIVDDDVADNTWRKLHADNWDAPFVVTTTVQLFESMFAARPSATRKLHRLTDAVVVLDEIQALPLKLLPELLSMMRQFVRDYGTTFLLASATQPPLWSIKEWWPVWDDPGDPAYPRDIVDVHAVPEATRRVQYEIVPGKPDWSAVADLACAHRQVLLVVNTTADAQALHQAIRETVSTPVYHLSSRMHARHKTETLATVRQLLDDGKPVHLVSTQLIEAGVDISFPVVFRALAPAESIVQSAGRCNREGELPGGGHVFVFVPAAGGLPGVLYRDGTETTRRVFLQGGRRFDDPAALTEYYKEIFGRQLDHGDWERIRASRQGLAFPATQAQFSMIEDRGLSVVIDQDAGMDAPVLAAALARAATDVRLSRADRRLISSYSALAPHHCAKRHDLVEEMGLGSGIYRWIGTYDPVVGLILDRPTEASIW